MSDEEYLKNPVGTGPYMLKDWTQGSSLTLEANPYYRVEGMPKTKEIKYVLIADDNTRLMQLQSGQIDVAPTFPFSLAQGVESNEALALDIFPSTQIYYLTVNTTKPPFDDVKVRQALYYALNKSELASAIAGEYGTPVAAIVSETQGDWCNTDLQVTEYAPDTAKQMLADAGYRPYYMYRQKGTLQNLENIGWAKPGFECLYNIYIMEEVHTILSAGAGGSTKLVIPGQRRGKIERIFNFKYPTEYIDRFAELLDRKKAVEDFYARYTSQTLHQP